LHMSIWRSLFHSLTGKSAVEVSAVSLDVDDYLEELLAKAFERNDLNLAIEEGGDVAYMTEVANRGKADIVKAATEERDALVSIAKVMQRSDEAIKVAMSILKVIPIPPFRGLLLFPWVSVHGRPGRGGQSPPRVRVTMAMAMSASALW
jgi:hypothetical protein